jgi:osmoprotectant transport system substrate-binding protein
MIAGSGWARRALAATAVALVCAACGGSVLGTTPTSTSSARASHTTSTTSITTPTSTTTATSASSSALPGTGKPQVTIGDKNYTEQFVLGELYSQALRAQGFSVQLNRNIGPTEVTLQALKTGSLSMYPEYLSVFDTSIAQDPHPVHSRVAAFAVAERWALAHGLELLTPTPFSDTDTIGVTVAYAEANHLVSLRDLGRLPTSLTVGGPPQFEQSSPGLATIERRYGFTVAGYTSLAVGDQYTALAAGTVQAADVGTTDGQLASGDFRALTDPEHLFGWGNAVPVVTAAVLTAEGPAFAETLDRVSALLTTPVMRQLNQAVDVAGEDPATVAKQFLETHGVIPASP